MNHRIFAPLGLLVLGGIIALDAGCTDPLARVDHRTRQIMARRAEELGDDTFSPTRTHLERLTAYDAPGMNRFDPPTTNPDAKDLLFTPADEQLRTDQAVADRLQSFYENAFGQGPDPDGAPAREPLKISFRDALRLAQRTGPAYLAAEESYILTALDLLVARRNFNFRFFNDTTATLSGFGVDGNFDHALNIVNTFGATRNLQTGGTIAASWVVAAVDQLAGAVSEGAGSSVGSTLNLSVDIPLLQGAGKIASESLIQAERNLVYAARSFERTRREILVETATTYFGLIEQQNNISNQILNLEGVRRNSERSRALAEAGLVAPFDRLLAEDDVAGSESTLASIREGYIFAVDNFKVDLGIPIDVPVEILPLDFDLPEPNASQSDAARAALYYSLDLQTSRDQLDDARRAVRNARNGLLPELDISGDASIPTGDVGTEGTLGFDPDDFDYTLSATFSLPLDRRIERANLRSAIIALEQQTREFEVDRDNLIIAARQSIRNINVVRFQLELAERQVEINERRLANQKIRDDVRPQEVLDTEADLVDARNALAEARADLRTAILNYLLVTDQLRVSRDGTLLPLPGLPQSAPGPDSPADAPGQQQPGPQQPGPVAVNPADAQNGD